MIRWTHLTLSQLSKKDAVTVVAMAHGKVLLESDIKGNYPHNNIVGAKLRTANLTAISIMAKIFNKKDQE